MALSLTKLRSFVAVAESKSFRTAAEQLNLSASAISAHVQQLETFFQIQLIQRTTRSLEVTEKGQRFLDKARALVESADELVRETRSSDETEGQTVRVGCSPSLTASILPAAIAAFRRKHPKTRVRILDGHGEQIVEWVQRGEADFALGSRPRHDENLSMTPLLEDRFVVVVPATHELASRVHIQLKELEGVPFLAMKASHGVRSTLEHAAKEAGIRLRIEQELVHHYSLGQLIQAGLGVAIIPKMTLPLLGAMQFISVPIVDPPIVRQIYAIKRRGVRLSQIADEFLYQISVCVRLRPDDESHGALVRPNSSILS